MVANKHDRLHLRSTHFAYARQLEKSGGAAVRAPCSTLSLQRMHAPHLLYGMVQAAMKHYEAAGTHRADVTRMLHEAGDVKSLEAYVNVQVRRRRARCTLSDARTCAPRARDLHVCRTIRASLSGLGTTCVRRATSPPQLPTISAPMTRSASCAWRAQRATCIVPWIL